MTHGKFNAPCKDRNRQDRAKTGLKYPEVPRCRRRVDRLAALCRQAPVKICREIILASIDGALGLHRRPGQAHQADADLPMTPVRNFDEILRALDSMQLTASTSSRRR